MTEEQTPPKTPAQLAYPDRYYAQYDPKSIQPAPVLGWYDMWVFSVLEGLPPLSDLLPLSEDFWADHIANAQTPRAVQDDKIVPYTPPKTLEGQQGVLTNLTAQKKSSGVYYQPAGASTAVLFPSDDTAYANALQEAQTVQLGAWTDGTQWTLADGSSTPMKAGDVTALFKKMAAYRSACQNYSATLRDELEKNLDTDLTDGWPSNQ